MSAPFRHSWAVLLLVAIFAGSALVYFSVLQVSQEQVGERLESMLDLHADIAESVMEKHLNVSRDLVREAVIAGGSAQSVVDRIRRSSAGFDRPRAVAAFTESGDVIVGPVQEPLDMFAGAVSMLGDSGRPRIGLFPTTADNHTENLIAVIPAEVEGVPVRIFVALSNTPLIDSVAMTAESRLSYGISSDGHLYAPGYTGTLPARWRTGFPKSVIDVESHEGIHWEEVVSGIRWLPEYNLGLLVEVDFDEAYRELKTLKLGLLTALTLALIAAISVAWQSHKLNTSYNQEDLLRRQRSEAERERDEVQRRLRSALRASGGGAWQFDVRTRRLWIDEGCCRMLGIKEQARWQDADLMMTYVVPEERRRLWESFSSAVRLNLNHYEEISKMKREDGDLVDVRISADVFRDDGGSRHFVGTLLDWSWQAEALRAVERARSEAEVASRAKSQFIASLSHELRTPLNAIQGFAQLLYEDKQISGGSRRRVAEILHGADTLTVLINNVLEFNRNDGDKVPLAQEEVDLHAQFSEVSAIFGNRGDTKNLDFNLSLSRTLPQFVLLDKGRFRRVVFCLMDNAVKFTDRGSITLSVKTETRTEVHGLIVEVCDTGRGIAQDDVDRVFLQFEQLESSRDDGGIGIGLALARSMAQQMGGSIRVRSELGKGTCFTLQLPLVLAESLRPGAAKESVRSNGSEQSPDYSALASRIEPEVRDALNELLELGDLHGFAEQCNHPTIDPKLSKHLKSLAEELNYAGLTRLVAGESAGRKQNS